VLGVSERATKTFKEHNLKILRDNYKIAVGKIDIIELIGGGSTRCVLAEKF
jgi:hypothetical protein